MSWGRGELGCADAQQAAPTATVTAAPTIACPAIDTSDNNFCNTVKRLHDSGQCTQTCAAQLLEIKLTLPTCLWTCAGVSASSPGSGRSGCA